MPSSRSGAPRPLVLLSAVLVLAAAAVLLLLEPWRSGAPTDVTGTRGGDTAGIQAEGEVAGREKQGATVEATGPAARTEVEATRVLRGVFVAPQGPWPGGGQAVLAEASELPEGGIMGLMNIGMKAARGQGSFAKDPANRRQAERSMKRMFGRGEPLATVEVHADGSFELRDPPAGKAEIRLSHPVLRLPEAVPVVVPVEGTVDAGALRAESAGALVVLVADEAGDPIQGAHCELGRKPDFARFQDPSQLKDLPKLMRDLFPSEATTDARGVARFDGVAPGVDWKLEVERQGLQKDERSVRLAAGVETIERVRLADGVLLEVTVLGPDGKPYPQARLSLTPKDPPEDMRADLSFSPIPANQEQLASVRLQADDHGVCRRKGIAPGAWVLRNTTAGYRPSPADLVLVRGRDERRTLTLDPGVTISGTVRDEAGEPVSKARVMHVALLGESFMGFDLGSMMGKDMLRLVAREQGIDSGDDGSFVLGGFEADQEAHLLVDAEGFDVARVDGIKAGATDVVIRLKPAVYLTGHVVDPDGKPVPAYKVVLSSTMWLVMKVELASETVADPEGRFRLDRLPREGLTLTIEAEGFAPFEQQVSLTAGSVDLGALELSRPGAIAGTTVDPDGRPVPDVLVRVAQGGFQDSALFAQMMGDSRALYRSDEEGRFRIEGLAPRRLRLLADKDGYAPGRSRALKVEAGKTLEGVVLALSRGGVVAGRVIERDGPGLAGWRVQAGKTDGSAMGFTETGPDGSFRIEALAPGVYKVDGFPKDLMARVGRASYDPQKGTGLGDIIKAATRLSVSGRVVVKDGEVAELELVHEPEVADPDAAAVEGSVTVGGRPLEKGLVTFQEPGASLPSRMANLRAGGRFEVEDLRPGSWLVKVRRDILGGQIGATTQVRVGEGGRRRVDLDLPGGRVEGKVLREDGAPAVGVILSLQREGQLDSEVDRLEFGEGTHLSGEGGSFEFEGLEAGTYDLVAKDLGFRGGGRGTARMPSIVLGAGEDRDDLVLTLGKGSALEVRVLTASGPKTNAVVTLCDGRGLPMTLFPRRLTDADGTARFDGLPDGRYRVSVEGPGAAPALGEAVLLTGGRRELQSLLLGEGVPTSLRWLGEIPEAWTGGTVLYTVWSGDGAFLRAGRLRVPRTSAVQLPIGSLTPGRYRLRLEHPLFGRYEKEHEVDRGTAAVWGIRIDDR
ncbi:MAG: carboxypeptidase-like regulatory domain-containing protein [Planctomycetota bacterium]